MTLPITMPYPPMEAKQVDEIPEGDLWQYEPKWDGFRCVAFRDGDAIELQSKAGKPLTRYFPDVVESLRALKAEQFVLDGEIVVPVGKDLSFNDLLQRIHPAASRIKKLASERPAQLIVFDLLVDDEGNPLDEETLDDRRDALERFAKRYLKQGEGVRLSPATRKRSVADRWFSLTNGGLDGVIAKRRDLGYASGERSGMVKIKNIRTAECVVGGFRYASKGKHVGSLLLGLYDDAGLLHHVGFTSGIKASERAALTKKIEAVQAKGGKVMGFSGNAPGGPSRWSTERSTEWEALPPTLVVEVTYDHFSNGRFRHGTGFLRWRPDKAPEQCTFDQVQTSGRSSLKLIDAA